LYPIIGLRSGGEGIHLPRYLTMHSTEGKGTPLLPTPILASSSIRNDKQISSSPKSQMNISENDIVLSTVVEEAVPVPSVPVLGAPSMPLAPVPLVRPPISMDLVPVPSSSALLLPGQGPLTFPVPTQMSVKHAVPPKKIMKAVGQAVIEWDMIQEGDRLLLG
jgi:hypothetical protein